MVRLSHVPTAAKATFRAGILAAAASAVVFVPPALGGAAFTENFDIAPVDWKGLDNGSPPQWGPYGWSNTNLTGGTSGAGEAGGTFLRTNVRNYYADTALGGKITEAMSFGASGEIYVSAPNADNDVIMGHFFAPPQGAVAEEANHAGILLRELDANNWRFMARIRGDGSSQTDGNQVIVPNGNYRFSYNFDPVARTVTAQLFPIGGGAAIATSTTGVLQAGEVFEANSFGWTGGFSGAGEGQNMQAAMDGVTYTTYMPKVSQHFNSSPADWVNLGSAPFGFSNTNHTAQESGPGEAGGTFAREDVRRAYADTTVQQLNQTVPFGASGEFFIGNLSALPNKPDTEAFIAHFAQDQVDGVKFGDQHGADQGGHNIVGLYVIHDQPDLEQSNFRLRSRVYTSDSTRLDGSEVLVPIGDGTLNFDYNWDPATFTLTARILDDDGVTVLGTSTLTLPASAQFDLDAFGLTNGFNGSLVSERHFDMFIDQASYITGAHWGADSNGDWGSGDNWNGPAPDGMDHIAYFGSAISAARQVNVEAAKTVGTMVFDDAQSYTISGSNTITFANPTLADDGIADTTPPPYANLIKVLQGSHTVSAPVALLGDTNVNAATGSTLTLANLQDSTVKLIKTGGGKLAVNGVRAGGLSVEAGRVEMLHSGNTTANTSHVGELTVATGAVIDLRDNKLITASPVGTWTGAAYDGVAGLVDSGRGDAGNALWNGTTGIITSDTRAINNGDLVSIGVAKVSEVRTVADTATTTFAGRTVLGSDTLAMVTWGGDANLDGKINIDDYGRIDGNVGQSGSVFGWSRGDFNYDGKINIDDYGIIDGNINRQGATFSTATALDGVGAVPEPAALLLAAPLAMSGLLRRRRR